MTDSADGSGGGASRYIEQLAATVRQLEADGASIGDLKVASTALRELRNGFRLFAGYRDTRKVSTFGSARTSAGDPTFRLAEAFARAIADAGFMVITGAGGGIMEACQRGAGRERSFGVNIQLPFEQGANPHIHDDPKLLDFHYFFTRKLFFLKEAHAVVLFPGGFGTHDEGFETLTLVQTGKNPIVPLVLLDRPRGTYWTTWHRYIEDHLLRRGMISREDLALYKVTDNVSEAVAEITNFYRVYHSARVVRDLLVLRVNYALSDAYLAALSAEFDDIIQPGSLRQQRALRSERTEPELAHLPRLTFRFERKNFGRLRMLINRINEAPAPGE